MSVDLGSVLASVDWAYVGILSLLAFIAALLGSVISFRNRLGGAILAGILFAVGFVYWTYYPHPQVPGPITPRAVSAATPAPAPGAPASAPSNPVSTLSQAPANPATTPSPPPANSPPSDGKQ